MGSGASSSSILDRWVPPPGKIVEDAETGTVRVVVSEPPPPPPLAPQSDDDDDDTPSYLNMKRAAPPLAGPGPSSAEPPKRRPGYDQISDPVSRRAGTDTDRKEGTVSRIRTRAVPMWYDMAPLLAVFVLLVLSAGIRCGVDEECGLLHATPSLGHFLNSTDTSALSGAALMSLCYLHYTLTKTTHQLVRLDTAFASLFMGIACIFLYAGSFASLLYPYWFVAIVPIMASVLWCAGVSHGLRMYYSYHPRYKRVLYYFSVLSLTMYVSAVVVYLVCSIIPLPEFPGKQVAVFVSEILMLVAGMGFVVLLVMHTRRVRHMYEVERVADSFTYVTL